MDIVDTHTRSNGVTSSVEYISMFSNQLTAFELKSILSEPTEDLRYDMFFLYWSMKEAFIKAIGQGLGYNLQNIEFSVHPSEDSKARGRKVLNGIATARIEGLERSDWR